MHDQKSIEAALTAKLAENNAFARRTQKQPFQITPIIHPQGGVPSDKSRTHGSATANALYIVREDGVDLFGPTPNFAAKLIECPDLVEHGRRGPIGCDAQSISGLDLWQKADAAAISDRPSMPVAYHIIGWLPTAIDEDGWREIIFTFLDQQIVVNGMIADWALHARPDGEGDWEKMPHMHGVLTARYWKGPRLGQPQDAWQLTGHRWKGLSDAWVATCGKLL